VTSRTRQANHDLLRHAIRGGGGVGREELAGTSRGCRKGVPWVADGALLLILNIRKQRRGTTRQHGIN
jgi:hypothetical protein